MILRLPVSPVLAAPYMRDSSNEGQTFNIHERKQLGLQNCQCKCKLLRGCARTRPILVSATVLAPLSAAGLIAATGATGEATTATAKNTANTRGRLNSLPEFALMARDDTEAARPRFVVNVLVIGAKAELLKHCNARHSVHSVNFMISRVVNSRKSGLELLDCSKE
jgi:hypothetical protein